MQHGTRWIDGIRHIYREGRKADDGRRCTVAPSPELKERIQRELAALRDSGSVLAPLARAVEPRRPGFNDGLIVPPDEFPEGTPISVIRSAAADRAPLRGVVRVIVVLVEFSDRQFTHSAAHFDELFFSTGVLATRSVREYFQEVTDSLIDIQGQVVGPYQLPQTLADYAHGAAGIGSVLPNARTMARDALLAADPHVDFTPYDNDGNGFVDAFIVVHAGSGGEQTGSPGDIWSHKWVLDGGARTVDSTKVYAYLTVPEDARIGVCCHELGHLLFGFPDLYDTDNSSEGIGNWCLMAGGSWGGGGDTPTHPSAWCKAQQGWATVDNRATGGALTIPDVKTSRTVFRLWKDGGPGSEYFLLENRQQTGFDVSLPGSGVLIWHIDESVSGNTDESHYKVALMQADGRRDMEGNVNRGDAGDAFPGSTNNTSFTNTSTPNSKSYAGTATCVAVTGISPSGPVMTATVQVQCKVRAGKEIVGHKELVKEKELRKELKDQRKEFVGEKGFSKEFTKELKDRKEIREGRPGDVFGPRIRGGTLGATGRGRRGVAGGGRFAEAAPGEPRAEGGEDLEARLAVVEATLARLIGIESEPAGTQGIPSRGGGQGEGPSGGAQPFISEELRPDLSQGALLAEDDYAQLREEMQRGSAVAKRLYDKGPER